MNGWDEGMAAPSPSAIWSPPVKKECESEHGEAPKSLFAEDKPSPPPEITDEFNFEPPPTMKKKSLRPKWTTVGHAVPLETSLLSIRQVKIKKASTTMEGLSLTLLMHSIKMIYNKGGD